MMTIIRDLYRHTLRRGPNFRRFLSDFEATEALSTSALQDDQNERLRAIVRLAYDSVPYYRHVFEERKLTPADIRTGEDLQKLPILDKAVVRNHLADLCNTKFRGAKITAHTGGTTGMPGVFLRDLRSINAENAVLWQQYRWAGKSFRSRRATIRGAVIVPIETTRPPFWRHNVWARELLLSSFHLSEANLGFYVEAIRRFAPFDLYSEPANAYLLADYCMRHREHLSFGAVFLSSDMVLPYQKAAIEQVFGCRIFDWYGSAERVAGVAQCEHGAYHVLPHYAVLETPPVGDGLSEVVGTSLHNHVMPLLRYRVGDLITPPTPSTCRCGRKYPAVAKLIGRDDDMICMPDGRTILLTPDHIFRGVENIREAQFVQHAPDRIEVRVVPEDPASPVDLQTILERTRHDVGGKPGYFTATVVNVIPRDRYRKYKFVVNLMEKSPERPRP